MGIQMKEEHSTTKDNFDESYGEETRNECSYDEEKEEKEPATAVSLMNLNHHINIFLCFPRNYRLNKQISLVFLLQIQFSFVTK